MKKLNEICLDNIIMFDMDGTLLDLAFDDFIWNEHLPLRYAHHHQCSLEQSQNILFGYYQQYKHTLAWYSSRAWTEKVGMDMLAMQYEHRDKIALRSGCVELLESLNAIGYRCWLVTNADEAGLAMKMQHTGIAPYFEHLISSETLGFAKEDPQFWQELQQRYPFNPEQVVFIDDTHRVLDAAHNYGITQLFTIWQPSSQQSKRTQVDYPALDDLQDLLAHLNLKVALNQTVHQ